MKNYGLKLGAIKETDYQWGTLPKVIINPSGDYTNSLPVYEPQVLKDGRDPQGCWIWGSLNLLEIILKNISSEDWNFSERFVFNGLEANPDGGDPFETGEFLRKKGCISEAELPIPNTYQEFITPRPLTVDLYNKAGKLLKRFRIRQEYVWNDYLNQITVEEKNRRIKEALPLGPIGVSLYAWIMDENGLYYRPQHAPDTHWCVLYKTTDKCDYVFDSYDHEIKHVRHDMNYAIAIRYFVEEIQATEVINSLPKQSLWSKIVSWFLKLYNI